MIYVVATVIIQKGSLPALLEAALPAIAATRKEVGCISYDLLQSQTAPETLNFVERWESREALNAHFTQPHFIKWRAEGGKYITSRSIDIISTASVETL